MKWKKSYYFLSFLFLVILAIASYFFFGNTTSDLQNSNLDNEEADSSDSSNQDEESDGGIFDFFGSSSGGSSGSSSQSSSSQETSTPYEGLFCGVSGQVHSEGEINLTTDFNDAHKVIFSCMNSALSSCIKARTLLFSDADSSTLTYDVEGMDDGLCKIKVSKSSGEENNCLFSQESISAQIELAQRDYPLLSSAQSYYVLSFAENGGGNFLSVDGEELSVSCS